MAVQRQFQAVISVMDRTAAPLRMIQARLAGLAPATLNVAQRVRYLGDRLRELAERPDIARMGAAARRVGTEFAALTRRVALLAAGFTAMGTAAAVAFYRMGQHTMQEAGRLADLAGRTGMTVQQLRGLEHAAGMAGVGAEQAIGAVERLQKGIAEAAAGRNKPLIELFQRLRIPLRDANGEIRTATQLLPELADAFQANENAALRTRMAMSLFGRAGAPLIAMLAQGGDALREQMAEGFRLNPQINDGNLQAIDRTEDAVAKLTMALRGMADAIGVRLLPELAPLIEKMTEWAVANQDILGDRVSEWVMNLARQVQAFDLSDFLDRMERWGAIARDIFERMDGLRGVLVVIGAVAIAPLVAAVAGLMLAMGKFGLIVAGIVGLGYGLYKAWEPLKAFFTDLFTGIADLAQRAWDRIKPIVDGARDLLRSMEGTGTGSDPTAQERRRQLFRDRALTAPGLPGPEDRQQLLRPQSFRPAPGDAELDINVRFDNLPAAARVDVQRSGAAPEPRVDVGFAALGAP